MRRVAVFVLVAMLLVAAIVVGVLVASSGGHSSASAAESARSFTAAWRRSLEGTWTAEGTSVRAGIRNPVSIVQRPPDRLVRRGNAVSGTVNGHTVSCVEDPSAVVRCHDGGAAPSYDSASAKQVADLTSEVGGPAPLYAVSDDGQGCFSLKLAVVIAAPPFGQSARFCFDAATGAPTLQEHDLEGVTDQQSFTKITPSASADSFALPAPLVK